MDSADRESDVQPLDVVFKCHDPLSLAQVEVEGPLSFQGQDVVILVKKLDFLNHSITSLVRVYISTADIGRDQKITISMGPTK